MKIDMNLIKMLGLGALYTSNILFVFIFIVAYLNSSKTALVDINSFGEANLEMWIMVPFALIFGTISFIAYLKDTGKAIQEANNGK